MQKRLTYVRQTRHRQTKGERDVHHGGWIPGVPGDAGCAADKHQKKRSQGLGEQHDQELDLCHLLEADKVLCTWAQGRRKQGISGRVISSRLIVFLLLAVERCLGSSDS